MEKGAIKRSVLVVCGSDSDFEKIAPGLALLRMAEAQGLMEVLPVEVCKNLTEILPVEVCSAHRNPKDLRELLWRIKNEKIAVVVMCACKLAALFGECDALSRNDMENDHTVFVAVPLKGSSVDSSMAAYLSATQVPNSQFVFKKEFFENPETAFEFAISGELPKIVLEKQKPPQTFALKAAYEKGRRKYPEKAAYDSIIQQLELGGLIHMYTGKTRETFLNPSYPDLLYVLATDRISIFDIVMNELILGKGADLTMITIFWLTKVFPDIPNHLVAYGSGIAEYLPAKMRELMGKPGLTYLMKNMIVVKRTSVLKVEAIVRGNLTGSGLKDYKKTGKVCGIELPVGLIDGSELPEIMFTPSTKADYGLHDENISFKEAALIIGEEEAKFVRDSSIRLFGTAKERLLPLEIIIADTKFEFGKDPQGNIILIDEIMTPDSSRFWPFEGHRLAMQQEQTPPSYDKQPIRIAGEAAGIKTTNPDWVPDQSIIDQTIANYGHIVQLVVGKSRERFWAEDMGIEE